MLNLEFGHLNCCPAMEFHLAVDSCFDLAEDSCFGFAADSCFDLAENSCFDLTGDSCWGLCSCHFVADNLVVQSYFVDC